MALYAALILLAFLFLFPFFLTVRNGLMADRDIIGDQFILFPLPPHWEYLPQTLFDSRDVNILLGLRNSAVVAALQTFFGVLFASMAGYALARVPFRGKSLVLGFILATMLVPGIVLFIPKFVLVAKLGWVNTLQGIVVPEMFSAFNAFMFRQYYLDFPRDMEEAGRVDGLSWTGVYRQLALPNSKGILTALGVLTFISSWNSFLWPLTVGQNEKLWTVQVAVSAYNNTNASYHEIFMSSVIAVVPLVVVFLLFQRWIIEGVKFTGSKG
ncbi:carbohydrate ABC transporter permease [Deinococcus sp. Arct2-2]|uniref:carbohydrate ABC transporter permease n=1 Tax=Deinococcus sp. Arct2-2 TaxID=2568653 RepID=UPI0010A3D780|nr:carbohydrate ABC transporter permease [Deinococcus sp. Arct2-2]THF66743.1 carbohydrate ABC transporter permease [Deinococcus sp. Arct2-2]